jgi:predicted membrane protein
LRVLVFGDADLGLMIWGIGFRVKALKFEILGVGFRVKGLRLKFRI